MQLKQYVDPDIKIPPPLPFKSFIALFSKEKMTFPENRNHICSHILCEPEWAVMPLAGTVSRSPQTLLLLYFLGCLDES